MKRISAVLLVLMVTIIGISPTICEAVVEEDAGYVSVNASVTREIAPNQAEITINVETSDKNMQKASNDNKIIADSVYSALKSIINVKNGDYIKTQGYSANPTYIYNDNRRVFDKFVVSNNVVVRTKNIDLVSKLVDTAIAKGATNVNDLQFLVADYDSTCNELSAEATKKAYTQANAVASSINSKIRAVKSINATCSSENNQRPMYKMMASSMDSVGHTPIESGKVKIYANVDASFYVN